MRKALICSECGICETYACPMGLFPRQVNSYLKGELGKRGIKYEREENEWQEDPLRAYRKAPSKRIATRLGVGPYYDYIIDTLVELTPDMVTIPLKQHIGAPAELLVRKGDAVCAGQLIGTIPEQTMGANVHCGVSGIVTEANASSVTVKCVSGE